MPDSEVIALMRSYKAALLRQESTQMTDMARRWLGVERRLLGQMDALAQQAAQMKRDGVRLSPEMLINEERYRRLMGQLMVELNGYTDYANDAITAQQHRLVQLALVHGEGAIEAQGIRAGFSRLPVEAVENIAGFASNGTPLRGLLQATWHLAADGITQELINGVALGYNPRKVARMMAQGSTASLNRMMTIARTESLRAYKEANLESYRRSGVVESYLRLATHDSRVCINCLLLEGTVYQLDEIMPSHPNCRCTLVPKIIGLRQPEWLKGEDWLMEQSSETQRDIMGKGRYYAWQNGDIELSDIPQVVHNPTWGDGLRATPLKELVHAH